MSFPRKRESRFIFLLFILYFSVCPSFADQPSPSTQAPDTQTTYLYDLKKLIAKSKENIKEVNEKIKEQAVLKRNQKREERARQYYEKGVELTNEGKLDEAREYFEKAIRITEHPEMAGYIKESQRRLRKEEGALKAQEDRHYKKVKQDESARRQEVEEAYKEAVDLYKQKKYHPAKDAFEHVDELSPDYRATASYLKIIDQDIVLADALAAKQQAVEIARQQKEAEAARLKEKQMWLAQIEQKEKERKDAVDKQAAEVYDEAVLLYKHKKFAEAKKKFQEVSWVIPDYKATRRYLDRIDNDARKEQERLAEEQKKALQEQRWEEEVAGKKQEALRQKELGTKEKQHQKDILEQAQFLYTAAVNLYDKKQMAEALDKFNDVERMSPDFKSTRMYIMQIDKAVGRQPEITETLEQKHAREFKEKTQEAQRIYDQALDSYRGHQWEEARAQFRSVDEIIPDYKRTHRYLDKIEVYIARDGQKKQAAPKPGVKIEAAPASAAPGADVLPEPSQPVMPPQIKAAVTLEDKQRQVQVIAELAVKSAQLYHQLADVAQDRVTIQTKRKMARLEKLIYALLDEQQRLLRQMQGELWRQQQQESKEKQQQRRAQAEKIYQEALEYWRSHDYLDAKIKFLALESVLPDYKSTRRYLSQIDEDIKRTNGEAVSSGEQAETQRLKELQEKENTIVQQRQQQEEEKERALEAQQQESLNELARKASEIYDEMIRLIKAHDYEGMKAKFTELENNIAALMTLENEITKRKDRQERAKQFARESIRQEQQLQRAQQKEDREIHAYGAVQPPKGHQPELSTQPSGSDYYKRRDIMQEQNTLFSEAVDRYEHGKFTQAKLLFGELADQHDRRAEAWLKKVDRAITHQLLRSQEAEERERTAFLQDQIKAQHQLEIIQERERQRQKKLTEELERQKHVYEDTRLLELRKEEVLKAQERERRRQEVKRLRLEEENEKRAQELRFHRVKAPEAAPASAAEKPSPPAAAPTAPEPTPAPAASTLTPKQVQEQIEISNKRKAFLDRKYAREQKEKERQARKKAAEDARQARIKAAEEARQKRLEKREKDKQRAQEKIKQQEIMRDEQRRQQDMEREESQRQSQLEAQRQAVRRQLEDGVESMYQDAMNLYNQGNYAAAADRFKDVQDILPGYKRSQQYMDSARQKTGGTPASVSITP